MYNSRLCIFRPFCCQDKATAKRAILPAVLTAWVGIGQEVRCDAVTEAQGFWRAQKQDAACREVEK